MNLKLAAHWAEIIASGAVVASLVFLIFEVRDNTRVLEQQSIRDRSASLNDAFLRDPKIPAILAKIKAVDGPEPGEQAFIDRYDLTYEEAAIFGRMVAATWNGLEAEFTLNGASASLEEHMQLLMLFPDEQLSLKWSPQLSSREFISYIEKVRRTPLTDRVEQYRVELERLKEQYAK
jgi:hypothetical protein